MANAKKILIIKMGGLGDHILASPTVKRIRELEPDAHITMLTGEGIIGYYINNPYLDRVLPIPNFLGPFSSNTFNESIIESFNVSIIDDYIKEIINEEFDYLYNPSHDCDLYLTGLVVSRIKAKRKIGFRQSISFVNGYDSNCYYTELMDKPHLNHIALYQEIFFDVIYGENIDPFDLNVFYSASDKKVIINKLGDKINQGNFVAIHVTGSVRYRSLTHAQVNEIIDALYSRNYYPVLVGSKKLTLDYDRALNLTGDLSILETAYLLSKCAAVICPDSGIKHLASIFCIPICEVSHIPIDLMHLNGPYLDGFKYSAIQFWAPRGGELTNHEVVFPKSGEFIAEDIASSKCIRSLCASDILNGFDRLMGLKQHTDAGNMELTEASQPTEILPA